MKTARPAPAPARLPKPVRNHLAKIGAKGGKAGKGKAKARTKAQARKAALKRWQKKRH
jgi:hypothetical protein